MEAFIDTLLGRLLATSVQTVLLTAVVWTLCRCVRRLSPAAQCWLWWLVGLQALVGLVAAPIQLPWLPQAPPQLAAIVPATQWNAIPPDSVVLQPSADETGSAWPSAVFLLWGIGLAAMACLTLLDWRRARRILRASIPCSDEQLLQATANAAATRGLRRAPRVHLSPDIDSPLVIGHLRPVLLLPTRVAMSGAELDMVLAHELWHLRRADLWWGCVPALARHLFFFHPCAHLAVREYGLAREADCDAAVVDIDSHSRRDYGRLLLRLGTDTGGGAGLAVGSPTFHALNRRLTMLQNTTFLSRASARALLVVVATIGVMPLRLVTAAATAATPATPGVTGVQKDVTPAKSAGEVPASDAQALEAEKIAFMARMQVLDGLMAAQRLASAQRAASATSDAALAVNSEPQQQSAMTRMPAEREELIARSRELERALNQATDRMNLMAQQAGPVPAPVPGSVPVYTGKKMTVNFENVPIRTLLQAIGDTSGRNMLIDDAVTGTITVRLDGVPWDQLLDIVLQTKGLDKRAQGDVIIIGPAEKIAAMVQAELAPRRAQ